jgi:hypothetical protein
MRPWPWLLTALLGCGTPSRHLTTRIVDDPMVLPRRMLSMGLTGQVAERPRPQVVSSFSASLDYGVGKRLELDGLTSLRWAILDDAPAPADADRRPDRLSLAVRGGAVGIGSSSLEGFTVLPIASVEVRKHVGAQARVSLAGTWQGRWVEHPVGWLEDPYLDDLFPIGSRMSSTELAADVLRQVGDHVALGVGASVHQLQRCTVPSCAWRARGGELWLGPHVRPWRWLTLSVHAFAGGRYRPVGQPVRSPDDWLVIRRANATWLGTSGSVAFQW